MVQLPNLPLIQERFLNVIKDELAQQGIRYPQFEVYAVFKQVWGSTALGFGGIGGQAITEAYTTVILNADLGCTGVFFGERLAYVVWQPNAQFWESVLKREMLPVGRHGLYETHA